MGVDFLLRTGGVTFDPGEVRQTVRIPICGDRTDEQSEGMTLRLRAANNATLGTAGALGLIVNDDDPRISMADASTPEGLAGSHNMVFTVTLNNTSLQDVSVAWRTADGTATAPEFTNCDVGIADYMSVAAR
jgi:hypothetical protein